MATVYAKLAARGSRHWYTKVKGHDIETRKATWTSVRLVGARDKAHASRLADEVVARGQSRFGSVTEVR